MKGQVSYQITTDCIDSGCGGKAVLTCEEGPLLFDTEKEAEDFIVDLGIDNAQVGVV